MWLHKHENQILARFRAISRFSVRNQKDIANPNFSAFWRTKICFSCVCHHMTNLLRWLFALKFWPPKRKNFEKTLNVKHWSSPTSKADVNFWCIRIGCNVSEVLRVTILSCRRWSVFRYSDTNEGQWYDHQHDLIFWLEFKPNISNFN